MTVGTLTIEPQRVAALPFIVESTEVLNLQAKEKGLVLVYDFFENADYGDYAGIISGSIESIVDDFCKDDDKKKAGMQGGALGSKKILDPPGGISSYLSTSDLINVDPHKMNQVIGNLISNAIKFTSAGQLVTIKARKIMPDLQYVHTRYNSDVQKTNNARQLPDDRVNSSPLSRFQGMINRFKSPQTFKSDDEYDIEHGGHNTHNKNNFNSSTSNGIVYTRSGNIIANSGNNSHNSSFRNNNMHNGNNNAPSMPSGNSSRNNSGKHSSRSGSPVVNSTYIVLAHILLYMPSSTRRHNMSQLRNMVSVLKQ